MFNSGYRNRRATDGRGVIGTQTQYLQTISPAISVSGWSISGSDDTALNPAGGQTVLVNGSGFAVGVSATVGGTQIGAVTIVSSTQISFTAPANAGGSYSLVVYNVDGTAGILVPGLVYSAVPAWTTSAGSIGSYYETTAINSQVVATADSSLTYTLASGSLPSGATLYANGVITGTAPVDSSSTTYTFNITATDAELQDTTRTFTLTVNVDVVTWVTPSSGATISLDGSAYSQALSATDAAGYAVSYTANTLPTGLTLSSGTISGTPTVEGNTSSLLTATAATTNRSSTNTVTWVVLLSDAYFKYIALGLSASSSLTTGSFVADNSLNNYQLTVFGDTRAQDFNPYQVGYYSTYHSANGVYLTGSNSLFNISSGTMAWCFEGWIYPVSNAYFFAIGNGSSYGNSFALDWGIGATNKFKFMQGNGSSNPVSITTTNTYTANRWYHVAVTKDASGVIRLFVNGTQDGTQTYTSAVGSGTTFVINGAYDNNGLGNNGGSVYASNYRFVINQPVYTANFTPSTAPLLNIPGTILLTCQSNRFVDNGPLNLAITLGSTPQINGANPFSTTYQAGTQYYSGSFNGSSDYLSTPATLAAGFGTGDYTVEYWIYATSFSNGPTVFDARGSTSAVSAFSDNYSTSGAPGIFFNTGQLITSSILVSTNSWAHVAFVRSSGTTKVYVNGAQGASVSDTNNYDPTTPRVLNIGVNNTTSGKYFSGYISNLRVTKGLAVYTANFVPATAPLAATQSAGTNIAAITQPSYSVLFNGSSQYLSVATNSSLDMSSGDFTMEGWVYLNGNQSSKYLFGVGTLDGSARSAAVWIGGTQKIEGYFSSDGSTWQAYKIGSSTVTASQWNHIAFVRSGTTFYIFLNGVSEGTQTGTPTTASTGKTGYIGAQASSYYLNGYISNARITKGQALYTTTFTPATGPLTTTSQGATAANVSLLTCQSTTIIDNSPNLFAITNTGTATVASPNPFATGSVTLLTTQSPTFVDNSYNSLTITAATTTVKPLAQSPFTPVYYSNYFNGASSISLANTSQAVLNVTTGATFTIEAWVNLSSLAATRTFIADNVPGNATAYWAGEITTGGYLKFWWYSGSQIACTATTTAMVVGTWYHVAVVANAGALSLYVNGISQSLSGTTTLGAPGGNTASIAIGQYGSPTVYMLGYISNLRITKSQALYTTTFTPSTTPLTTTSQSASAANVSLLTCQSPYFIDTSTTSRAITQNSAPRIAGTAPFTQPGGYSATAVTTYGSGYFDGSGDYISGTTTAVGTNSFTYEAWIYPTATGQKGILSSYVQLASPGDHGILLQVNSSNQISAVIQVSNASTLTLNNSTTVTLNTWTHAAVTRSGTACTLWVNGLSVATGTYSGSLIETTVVVGTLYISPSSLYFTGYIADARVVNGTAVYTSAFVPSFTTPLTAVTNTQLLTLQTRGAHNNSDFIDQSSFDNLVTRSGNVSNGTFSPYGNNFSVYFDGSSYISTPAGLSTAMGTGFAGNIISIEMFVYPTNLNNGSYTNSFIGAYQAVAANGRWHFWHTRTSSATTTLGFSYTTGTGSQADLTTTSSVLNQNQWNNIAVTVDATTSTNATVKIFANGSLVQTWTGQNMSTQTTYYSSPNIGGPNSSFVSQFAGYISNLQILKGAFAYTGNYTVPTSALQNTSATVLNTCQSNRFVDVSVNNFTMTPSGATVTAQKFSPFSTVTVPTYYSGYFDGNGDYLSVPSSSAFAIPTSTTPFTVEAWIYPTAAGGSIFTDQFTSGDTIPISFHLSNGSVVDNTGGQVLTLAYYSGSSWTNCAMANTNVTLNQWQHVAAVFTGSTCKLFIAGADVTKSSSPTPATTWGITNDNGSAWLIGRRWDTTGTPYFTGFISNFRFTKGQALYTSAFTPSTTPLTTTSQSATASNVILLTCQSNTFIDNSPNYFVVTAYADAKPLAVSPFTPTASSPVNYNTATFGGSMYFDGSDYLTVTNSVFTTSGDFTVECWAYVLSAQSGNYGGLFSTRDSSNSAGISINLLNTGYLDFGAYPGGGYTSTLAPLNQWFHVAMTRSGSGSNNVKCFLNGVQVGTISGTATTSTNSGLAIIGRYYVNGTNQYFLSGYISDLRYTVGTALYTANFYPGASPATPAYTIGTTSYASNLLLSGAAGGVIDYSRTVDMETLADARVTSFSPYNGGYYSVYFAGNTYLSTANTALLDFGTGDFTIEFWMFAISMPNTAGIIGKKTGDSSNGWQVYYNSSVAPNKMSIRTTLTNDFSSTSNWSLNTWEHWAVSRSSGTIRWFKNGVLDNSASNTYNISDTATTYMGYSQTWGGYYTGYTSNLRVVKGAALYTSNFVPSTTPLTTTSQGATTSNVSLLTCQSNRFVDNSTNALTITASGPPKVQPQNPFALNSGISYYFDGTGDYLSMPSTPTNNFGAGNFTIEFWINPTTWYGSVYEIGGASKYLVIYRNNSVSATKMGVRFNDSAGSDFFSTADVPTNQWSFWALVRNNGTLTWYFNGTASGTTSYATSIPGGTATVGYSVGFNIIYTGYVTDLRVTNGYARYTSAFTPPSVPYKTN